MASFLIRIIGILLFFSFANEIFSQTRLAITNLEEKDQKLFITYDILNCNKEDLFDVNVQLTTTSGNVIRAKNVDGDINKKLVGGEGYKIIWDLVADSIFINEDVEIQIDADVSVNLDHLRYTSLMLSSTLLPGVGLKKITRKKSYLFLGLLGYTGIGATAYFYFQGQNLYSDYQSENDPVRRADLLDNANRNRQNATIAGLSAAGIWLVNYALFTSNWYKKKRNSETASLVHRKINFYANYHPGFNAGMVTVNYHF